MFNISLNVLLFHHFNIDQATAIMAKKKHPKTKRNKNKTFFNYGDSSQCPFFPFEFILYSYHSLYGART